MEKIGRYEIEGQLGRGAMGIVWKAYDPRLERHAAIKVMNTSGEQDDEELRARFFHEARSAAKLNHPNIIAIYDLGEDERRPFIAMEYLEGEDLRAFIERHAFIPFDQKLRYTIEICEALDYAHRHDVVHRDIKPGNIFITGDGTLKIVDFGLARVASSEITSSGVIMGSPYYMSPEQVRGLRDIDGRSDLFSVGVLLYELISYNRPFEGENPTAVCFRIVSEPHLPISHILPGCSPDLVNITERVLCKDREQRYQTGAELAKDLSRFAEQLPRTHNALKKEMEELKTQLNQRRKELDDPLIRDLVREGLVEQPESKQKGEADDYGILLFRHADLSKANQLVQSHRETETRLQLNTALGVARDALEQQDVERCIRAASAALEVIPTNTEALELKRRALLLRKMRKFLSPEGRLPSAETGPRKKVEPHTYSGELLDFARTQIDRGNVESALRNLTFLLQLDPDHSEALKLRQTAEAALRGERVAEAPVPRGEEAPPASQPSQRLEPEPTQVLESEPPQPTEVEPQFAVPPETTGQPEIREPLKIPLPSKRLVMRLAAIIAVALLAAAVVRWWPHALNWTWGNTGSLVLNVAPWATVESIVEADSGKVMPLEESLSTPCVVSLPEGRYRIRVSNPHFGEPLEFEVRVLAGQPSLVHQKLRGFDLEKEISTAIGN